MGNEILNENQSNPSAVPPSDENKNKIAIDKSKISIVRLEMPIEMKDEALKQIFIAKENCTIEKDIATNMKKHFDEKFGGSWHCIVGKGFGCSIAYDTQFLIFYKIEQLYVLIFKSVE